MPPHPPSPLLISHGFQINYERGFCNGLASQGWRPTLISSDRTDSAHLHTEVRCLNFRGSQEENRPAWQKALNLLRYHFKTLAWMAWRRPAVVHVIGLLDPIITCGLLHGLWYRLWSRRYVLTVHDLLPHDRHTPTMHRWHAWAYALPHHLVVHTDRMKVELMERFQVPGDKITVMEHGIEPLDDSGPASPHPTHVKTPTQRPRLLAFGRVCRYKGLDVLLKAQQHLQAPARELFLCGRCLDGELIDELNAQIAALPAEHHVRWRNDYVSEAEVAAAFGQADMLVLPYRHIDQSGVLFQALRFGVPIVATDVGQFSHYVDPTVGEICPHVDDPVALAQAIERLWARRAQWSREAIQARARAFEWPRVVGVLREVYTVPS